MLQILLNIQVELDASCTNTMPNVQLIYSVHNSSVQISFLQTLHVFCSTGGCFLEEPRPGLARQERVCSAHCDHCESEYMCLSACSQEIDSESSQITTHYCQIMHSLRASVNWHLFMLRSFSKRKFMRRTWWMRMEDSMFHKR